MTDTLKILTRAFLCLVVITIGSLTIVAQSVITGTWEANQKNWNNKHKDKKDKVSEDDDFKVDYFNNKDSANKIYLNFRYKSEKGGSNNQGSMYSFDELQGLDKSKVESANQTVNFRLAREAGTIECTGTFQNGKGSGTFRFTPNNAFASAMRSRGFEFSDRKLFSAATLDVTTAQVDDLITFGFKDLNIDDIFKAKIFKVDSNYAREMTATGFPNLDLDDLVKTRIFKIDANFIREVVAMGFKSDDLGDLVLQWVSKVMILEIW